MAIKERREAERIYLTPNELAKFDLTDREMYCIEHGVRVYIESDDAANQWFDYMFEGLERGEDWYVYDIPPGPTRELWIIQSKADPTLQPPLKNNPIKPLKIDNITKLIVLWRLAGCSYPLISERLLLGNWINISWQACQKRFEVFKNQLSTLF